MWLSDLFSASATIHRALGCLSHIVQITLFNYFLFFILYTRFILFQYVRLRFFHGAFAGGVKSQAIGYFYDTKWSNLFFLFHDFQTNPCQCNKHFNYRLLQANNETANILVTPWILILAQYVECRN